MILIIAVNVVTDYAWFSKNNNCCQVWNNKGFFTLIVLCRYHF